MDENLEIMSNEKLAEVCGHRGRGIPQSRLIEEVRDLLSVGEGEQLERCRYGWGRLYKGKGNENLIIFYCLLSSLL